MKQEIRAYLDYLRLDKRVTERTLKNYESTLTQFARSHQALTERTVKTFLRGYDHAPTSNVLLTRLRGFAEFLGASLGNIPQAKEESKDPKALNSVELVSLITEATRLDSSSGLAISLLGHTGLRIHEFFNLKREDLQTREGVTYLAIFGKGRKWRDVPLNATALSAFAQIEWPFPVYEKKFRIILKQAGLNAGLSVKCHPHLLRASCASILLNERNADSVKVAKILGWEKVDTLTKHYYKASLATLASVMA